MQVDRHVEVAAHLRDTTDVIDVRVGEPDRVERRAGVAHHLDEPRGTDGL